MRISIILVLLSCGNIFSQSNYLPFNIEKEQADFLNSSKDSATVFYSFKLYDTVLKNMIAYNYDFTSEVRKKSNVIEINTFYSDSIPRIQLSTSYLILSPDCYHFFIYHEKINAKPKSIVEISKSLKNKPTELFLNFLITQEKTYLIEFLKMPKKEIAQSTDFPIHPDLMDYLAGNKFINVNADNKYIPSKNLKFYQRYIGCK
jgi:hypothetical protein